MRSISLPAAVLALVCACTISNGDEAQVRGAEAVDAAPWLPQREPDPPDSAQSAAVVVGVRTFIHDSSLFPVTFAVDDAIDFAYRITADLGLIPARRLLLLLAGDPDKPESKARLAELSGLGAETGPALLTDIYPAVERQAKLVGQDGILFVFFATHGFSEGAAHLLLAADSQLRFRTGVTADRLLEASKSGGGGLRLFVLDACRDQIQQSRGEASGTNSRDPRSTLANSFPMTLSAPAGYIVISASSPGGIAIPGDGNGLLTEVLLEGLRCGSPSEVGGFVTVKGLDSFLKSEVFRRSNGVQLPEIRMGNGLADLHLIRCRSGPAPSPPERAQILKPEPGVVVGASSQVQILAPAGLFARAVIRSERNGVFYTQSPEAEAISVPKGGVTDLSVQFGSPGRFQIYVGLGGDSGLLQGDAYPESLPLHDSQARPVVWLGPVPVVFPSSTRND